MRTIVVCAVVLVAITSGIHGQSSPEEKKQICEPGTTSKVDCNTCVCSQDGTALACTRKMCPEIPAEYLNVDDSIKKPHEIHGNPLLRTKRNQNQICEPGTRTKVDCNTCICAHHGTGLVCTKMECPKIPAEYLNADGSIKKPHEIHGNPLLRTKRNRQLRDIRCTPNKRFKDDCNRCICSADGSSAACTMMACPVSSGPIFNSDGSLRRPHQNNPLLRTKRDQVCVPGKIRTWDCNECRCSDDGTAEFCTREMCPKVSLIKRDAPLRCTPNESFMQKCNRCICSADGRSAACTYKFCL